MSTKIPRDLLEAYSRGEISRKAIGDQLQAGMSFGDLFAALLEHELPLPRFPSHPDAPGVQLVKRLAARNPHGA